MNQAIPALTVIALALTANAQDEGPPIPWEQDHPLPAYWEFFVSNGPIFFGLHLLMLATFVASVVVTVRGIAPHLLPYLCLAPCLGSSAVVWLAIFSLRIRFEGQFQGDIYGIVAGLSRPLVLGSALSAIAVVLHHVFSTVNPRTRNA